MGGLADRMEGHHITNKETEAKGLSSTAVAS